MKDKRTAKKSKYAIKDSKEERERCTKGQKDSKEDRHVVKYRRTIKMSDRCSAGQKGSKEE